MKRVAMRSAFLGVFGWWLTLAPQGVGQPKGPLISSIQGPALYQAYCASCHGADAKGNGPVAKALKNAPPDLTRINMRNGGKFPLARISRIISGEESLASHGTHAMPVWGPIFSRVDADQDLGPVRIDNLARYLRDLQAK